MTKNITLTQAQLDALVKNAVADALAQAQQVSTTKSSKGRKAPAQKKMVLNHNGKLRTEAQAANDLRLHEAREAKLAKMTKEQRKEHDDLIANIQANKAAEQERTRALEKALKVKAGSFKSTAVSVQQAMDAGWKPKATGKTERREELKAIKAKIRA